MLQKPRFGLRAQLLTIALIAMLPGFGILFWHFNSEWNHAIESAEQRSKIVAGGVTRDLWGVFRDYREIIGELARQPQVRALQRPTCEAFLRDYAAVHREIASITVRDLNGEAICSSNLSPARRLPETQTALIAQTVKSDGFYVSGAEFGPSSQKWVVGLTFPVRDDGLTIRAVLFVTLDLLEYSRRVFTDLPDASEITVMDRDLRVTMRSSDLKDWVGRRPSSDLLPKLPLNKEGFLRGREKDGTEYLAAYMTEPLSGWLIMSKVPEAAVLGPQERRQAWELGIGVVCSLIFVLALLRVSGNVANPLLTLAATAARVAGGNLQARARDTGAPEIREVARQFNTMLDALAKQRAAVEDASDEARAVVNKLTRLEEIGVVGGFNVNLDTGKYTFTAGSCLILGLDPTDHAGIEAYVHSGRFVTTALAQALERAETAREAWAFELPIETTQGHKRWIFTRGEPEVRYGQVTSIVGHIRDITAQKEAAYRLATLGAIVENTDDAIIGVSLSGMVLSWNAAAQRLYGYTAEEMIGRPIGTIIPRDLTDEGDKFFHELSLGHSFTNFETRRVAKSGEQIDVALTISPIRDTKGIVVGISKIARSLTERRKLDLRLQSVIEAAPVPYIISNNQRDIIHVNHAFTRIFGYELDEIRTVAQWQAKMFPAGITMPALETVRSAHTSHVHGDEIAPPMEMKIMAKDGSIRETIAAFARLPDFPMGEWLACLQDVTELKATQNHLRESQKMEAFGRMASGVAHDFNNLLGIIAASAEVLDHQNGRTQDTRASTGLILRACERGADLTRRLLIFSRRSKANPQSVNVRHALEELSAVLRRTLGGHIAVEIVFMCEDAFIFVDATLFHTALYNLAINARDAMPEGGTLTFQVERIVHQGQKQDTVTITVSDTGHGMPPDVTQHVFEPFFTTKETGKGTGLGLSMVYGFVTDANGEILVDSKVDGGTAFTLRFPAAQALGRNNDVETQDEPGKGPSMNVLLVEDDNDLREATCARLVSLGLSVSAAATTAEAIALLDSGKAFDLLVTDFRLSEPVNGAQLARIIQQRCPDLPVIVTSGYLDLEDARALDPTWVLLEKPVSKKDLLEAIDQLRARGRKPPFRRLNHR
ncbi:MAG: PAS domain S-box protein [Proteobacteria bacterium]|nr:PAS domain S-box protein [Pseudomonadota bacterium]